MARTKMSSPDRKHPPRGEDPDWRQNGFQGGHSTSVQGGSSTTTDDSSARRYPAPAPAPRGGGTEGSFAGSSSSASAAPSRGADDGNGAGLRSFFKSRGLTSSERYPASAPSPARGPAGRTVAAGGRGRAGPFARFDPPGLCANNGRPHPRDRADQLRRETIGFDHPRPGGRVGQFDRQDGRISEQESRRGHDDRSSWDRRDSSWDRRGIGEYHRGCDQDMRSDRDYGRSHDRSSRTDRREFSEYSHALDRDDDRGRGDRRSGNSMPRKKRHRNGQACASAPAKNWESPSNQTNQASLAPLPAPALVPPPAPLQGEHADTDRLKRELDRINYEKEISRANSEKKMIELENMRIDLEKKKIEQQLIQMSSNCAMPVETAAASRTDVQPSAERYSDKSTSKHLMDARNCERIDSAAASGTAAQPSAGNDSDASAPRHVLDAGDCDFDGAEDDVPATRISSNGNKKCAQKNFTNPSDSSKRKSNHCGNEESTTSQQLRAQMDRSKKKALLKAFEKDLAMRKKKDTHIYSERDLKSSFTPNIIDHYLLATGEKKFLVEWDDGSKRRRKGSPNDDRLSPSWINQENFLFPALARKYLTKKLKSKGCKDKIELTGWIEDCEEQERCLQCVNTIPFSGDDVVVDDIEEDTEIDFCCYLCKCPWDHPLKRTIRQCGSESLSTYHRACCHGYQDKEEWKSFVSQMGKFNIGKGDTIEITHRHEPEHENGTEVERGTNSVTTVDGNNEMFHKCLQTRQKRHAVVVCINAGVGSGAVALKGLGIRVEKMIHVEADRVAQHVIRSIHDYSYGETQDNDEIKHVVGLYETVDDIAEAPEKFVEYNGPIDLVICKTPRGKSTTENAQFVSKVFDVIEKLKRLNEEKHVHLHYLLEFPLCIKDLIPLHGLSQCVSGSKNVHVCNWPIPSKIEILAGLRAKHNLSGQPQDCLHPVTTLYDSLRSALSAGTLNFSAGQVSSEKWRDVLHPKYWVFLGLGPKGYDIKVSDKEFRLESALLRLRSPDDSDFFTDVDYAQHLLDQSLSVPLLLVLLSPLKDVFNVINYGRPYRVEESENTSNNTADAAANDVSVDTQVTEEVHDHGGTSSPNSNEAVHAAANDVSVDVQVKEEELEVQEHSPNSNEADYAAANDVSLDVQLKEEELEAEDMSTDDEKNLFRQVERSFTTSSVLGTMRRDLN